MSNVLNQGLDEAWFDYLVKSIQKSKFYRLNGVELTALGLGTAEFTITNDHSATNSSGYIHGGLIMTVADSSMGNAVRTRGIKTTTVDFSTSFLRPTPAQADIICRGEILKLGKNLVFTAAKITADDILVATSKGTFYNFGSERPYQDLSEH